MEELKYFHGTPRPIEPKEIRVYGSGLVKEVLKCAGEFLIVSNTFMFGGTYLSLDVFKERGAIERHYAETNNRSGQLRTNLFNIVRTLGIPGEELAYLLFEDKK